jgi:hypothetical protein
MVNVFSQCLVFASFLVTDAKRGVDSSSADVSLNCEDEVFSEEHNNSSDKSTSEQLDRNQDHGKANKSKFF